MSIKELGFMWYELFSRHAEDLYPGRYTISKCLELADQAVEISRLAKEKKSTGTNCLIRKSISAQRKAWSAMPAIPRQNVF